MNTLYQQFLEYMEIPTEEQFNELLEDIPHLETLSDSFDYNKDYFDLHYALETESLQQIIGDLGIIEDVVDKKVSVVDVESPDDLRKIKFKLDNCGYSVDNYEEELQFLIEDEKELELAKSQSEKRELLYKLDGLTTTEKLKEILNTLEK